MSRVVRAVSGVLGGGSSGLEAQSRALRAREREVAATAAGQRAARTSNRGLLAYIDDNLTSTLGGN